ncbi:MAG: hypothetical protein ACI8UO_002380 [Verrucomicrobiales bacterium]|jgi:hypothetical protein
MITNPESSKSRLHRAIESSHGQLRNLRERLETSSPNGNSDIALAGRLKSIENAVSREDDPAAAARKSVSWAIDIIDVLANHRENLSRPAYLAASRLSAALLMISQLDSAGFDSMILDAFDEALHQVAAQCLILELSHVADNPVSETILAHA